MQPVQNKKVLVTGAGGFIGSHLTEALVQQGHSVKAFVRYNSKQTAGWLDQSDYRDPIEIVFGDIRDFDSVQGAMADCDTVFHLAALIGIPYSYVSPLAYIKTNIVGTYNVLESARRGGLRNVLVTSTSETYGSAQYSPIDEKHPKVGQSPYSATKIAADELALSYHKSFDLSVKIVRPFNTYGPRQSTRAIIPTIITQVLSGGKQVNLGSLCPTRDLVFVTDTVEGFIKIADADEPIGQATNIATQQEISIGDLAGTIINMIDPDVEIISDDQRIRPEKSEVTRLLGSNEKIKSITGWAPSYDLKKGLEETIAWFQNSENLKFYKYNCGRYDV